MIHGMDALHGNIRFDDDMFLCQLSYQVDLTVVSICMLNCSNLVRANFACGTALYHTDELSPDW